MPKNLKPHEEEEEKEEDDDDKELNHKKGTKQ
jgi:hypothetical protein